LLENVSPVLGRSDHHSVLGASESIRPIDGVLKERTGPYEGTVLLLLVITEPLLDESPDSPSFAASKHDRPQLTGINAHGPSLRISPLPRPLHKQEMCQHAVEELPRFEHERIDASGAAAVSRPAASRQWVVSTGRSEERVHKKGFFRRAE
jgi:hypothetical protein